MKITIEITCSKSVWKSILNDIDKIPDRSLANRFRVNIDDDYNEYNNN